MEKLLSNHDIEEIVGEELPVIISSDLGNFNNLDELFGDNDKALILYEDYNDGQRVNGHWCCLVRKSNDIYFYDSYGGFIDDQLNSIHPHYREKTNQLKRHLSELLYDSPYENIHYNPHKHQKHKNGVNTCGRHCGVFLKFELDPEEYNDLLKDLKNIYNENYDKLIVDLTKKYI